MNLNHLIIYLIVLIYHIYYTPSIYLLRAKNDTKHAKTWLSDRETPWQWRTDGPKARNQKLPNVSSETLPISISYLVTWELFFPYALPLAQPGSADIELWSSMNIYELCLNVSIQLPTARILVHPSIHESSNAEVAWSRWPPFVLVLLWANDFPSKFLQLCCRSVEELLVENLSVATDNWERCSFSSLVA